MARGIYRLSAAKVRTAKPGLHADGGNLYLRRGEDGTSNWIFRFAVRGRSRDMGLGSTITVSLNEARDAALACRKLLRQGIDPIEHRRAQRAAQTIERARQMTFDQCAEAFIASHRSGWRGARVAALWTTTLKEYASPVLGPLPVAAIDVALVMKVLQPVWTTKPETAGRLRGRIERILSWAKVRGYREGENPARWRGHLDHLLPARSKVRKVEHRPALPYAEIASFMAELRERDGISPRAIEFLILTAARTNEVLGATVDEFDLEAGVWTVPAARMKSDRAHRVPLSAPAIAIVKQMMAVREGEYLFPGGRHGRPLSATALLEMLQRRIGRTDLTVHGFRATFKTWATERSNFQREVVEAALAHAAGDALEAAYMRGDIFEKRRRLMSGWAAFCMRPPIAASVVPLRSPEAVS
jgi:integrase